MKLKCPKLQRAISHEVIFMPPTSKKLEGHIASGLFVRPSVIPSVRPFVTLFDA